MVSSLLLPTVSFLTGGLQSRLVTRVSALTTGNLAQQKLLFDGASSLSNIREDAEGLREIELGKFVYCKVLCVYVSGCHKMFRKMAVPQLI